MIYDCFPFFNELDLLELRLNELDSVVDKFVLVEATKTFQKEHKPLYYGENKERFKQFERKIVHIVVDKFPGFFAKFRVPTAWDFSNFQKDQVARGLVDCRPDDIIIISDLDEIPRAEKVKEYKNKPGVKVFQQLLTNYYFNCVAVKGPQEKHLIQNGRFLYWRGSVMVDYRDFCSFKATRLLRDRQTPGIIQIENGGWHFSFLGDWEKVVYKLRSWEHAKEQDYNRELSGNSEMIKELIARGEDLFGRDFKFNFIPLDESFPNYLVQNESKFSHLIKTIV